MAATFRSAWALDLLCLLRSGPGRRYRREELVGLLSASRVVVEQSVAALAAVGLVATEPGGEVRYAAPVHLAHLIAAVAELYQRAPDAVRRAIARGNSRGLAAFADAFRLRSDK